MCVLKLKFHGTDTETNTDTDFLADFRTRILVLSDTRTFPREDVCWGCAHVHVYVYCI